MPPFPLVLECIRDLTLEHIQELLHRAKQFKDRPQSPFLLNPRRYVVATNFLEHSTRTKLSFMRAIDEMGARHLNFETLTSSLKKGESLEDTFITLKHLGVQVCVFRTGVSGELNRFKEDPPFALINAGDGMHQHPTQALLDVFTLQEMGMDLRGKRMAIIGDCLHSRVCHSLMELIPRLGGELILTGPSFFVPPELLKDFSDAHISISHSLEDALKEADILYLLRVQKERHKVISQTDIMTDYHDHFGLTSHRYREWGHGQPILHPGPANVGVEIEEELMRTSDYKAALQVEHSIPMRMAILDMIFDQLEQGSPTCTN